MATEWFYARGDQKQGPVSSAELGQLARSGKLLRTDLIWKEGMSEWRPAGEAAKLFEGVTSPEPSPSNVAPPPSESATVAFGDRARAAAKSLGEKAKSAAQAAAAQAEIASLTQIGLPSAYAAVGRHVIQSADIRVAFPDAVAVIDTLLAKLESLKTGAANRQPSTFAEKAKAVALATKEFAESKAHELRLGQAYAELGRSVFEAGSFELPAELAGPITDGIAKVDTLRKTAQISVTKERRPWITKRRLLVGGGLLATVVCLSMLGQFTGRNTPARGRPLKISLNGQAVDKTFADDVASRTLLLRNVKGWATESSVVVTFDMETTRWTKINKGYQFVIRLFDKNGQHLTNVITREQFTPEERLKGHFGLLLKKSGNRLEYPVSVRDLRDAAMAEVGFYDPHIFGS